MFSSDCRGDSAAVTFPMAVRSLDRLLPARLHERSPEVLECKRKVFASRRRLAGDRLEEGQDELRAVLSRAILVAYGCVRRTNRREISFQIRSGSGSYRAPAAARRPRFTVIPARTATAVISTAVTWCDITDTSAAYCNDSNVRIASTTCGSARTSGRTYARFTRIANFIASTSRLTRSSLGRNIEMTKVRQLSSFSHFEFRRIVVLTISYICRLLEIR